jgi:hypothetical protein
VGATLELEPREGTFAGDGEDRLLDPTDPGLVEAHHLGPVSVALRIAHVHAQELTREEGSLVPAGPGPDLHDHVAVIRGVPREQEDLELLHQPRLFVLQPAHFLASHGAQLLIRLAVAELPDAGQLPAAVLQMPERRDHGLQPRELASEAADLGGVRADLGTSQLLLQGVVLSGDLVQLGVEVGHAPG